MLKFKLANQNEGIVQYVEISHVENTDKLTYFCVGREGGGREGLGVEQVFSYSEIKRLKMLKRLSNRFNKINRRLYDSWVYYYMAERFLAGSDWSIRGP